MDGDIIENKYLEKGVAKIFKNLADHAPLRHDSAANVRGSHTIYQHDRKNSPIFTSSTRAKLTAHHKRVPRG